MVSMMRLRIDLAYDGGAFYGWARQPRLRTVQGEVELALAKVLHMMPHDGAAGVAGPGGAPGTGVWPRLVVAGRTDTGVHAMHQVCHVDVEPRILERCVGHMAATPVQALERRLRHVVPDDIVIHRVSVAPDGFDARFSALERTYVYRVCDRPSSLDPRMRGFVASVDGELDVEAMNEAVRHAIGLHDFGSFATPNPGGTTIREVKSASWSRVPASPLTGDERVGGDGRHVTMAVESGLLCFTIIADAFAHNMVRSLVNGCLQVGRGKKTVDWFRDKISHPVREGSTGPAAARGLTLEYVQYPPDDQLASRASAIRARRTLP